MTQITSTHNQKLKEIRKRRRERERAGRFVAEGEDLLAAADTAGWEPVERFCVAGSGLAGVEVPEKVLASTSGLGSGTRTLAVYEERWIHDPSGPLCVYLYGVHDPGNVGTILRSAEAFGVASVAIGPGTADPFSPKAVRASMGALFEVPLARAGADLEALPGVTVALVAGAGRALAELTEDWRSASTPGNQDANPASATVTLLIGAEREGLPDDVIARADHTANIPIRTHSLNAAVAATVALYELTRMPPPAQ
jgi:RNA methyltransferase, TrmH family